MIEEQDLLDQGLLRKILICVVVAGVVSSNGCFFRFVDRTVKKESVPIGVELQELKVARDRGAITEEEYRRAKQRLLENRREDDSGDGASE